MTDVLVVGAGIVGASVAYHAARAGAAVLLIDRSLPASGVTGDSFAWVRGPSAQTAVDSSTPLRRTALEDWARLERDVSGVRVRWSGSLAWGKEARSHDGRLVDADEIRRLEPNLRAVPREAIWRPRDVEVPALCTAVGVELPIAASPAVLLRFEAPPGLLRRVLHCPLGDFRQTEDGTLLAAAGTANQDELQRSAHATLQRLNDMLGGAHDLQLSDVRIGVRPMPVDGLPIIGSLPGHPGGYLAVMHSAVTLAPAAGRLVADELIGALDPR